MIDGSKIGGTHNVQSSLDCTLCVGLTIVRAYSLQKDENELVENMEQYCNGTILFREFCLQMMSEHRHAMQQITSSLQGWGYCSAAGFCSMQHYSMVTEYMSDVPRDEQLFYVPLQLMQGLLHTMVNNTTG